ncbi:MAG: hypothetical protein K0R24_2283 [Gammaproteobacteria bacterium]|jgi:hypothetical protein|nr:hypothetical protein [Gammaproteobacteria bacterium]
MIALTLSLLILTSLSAVYLATQHSQQTQTAIITLIENSRIAKSFLKSALKNHPLENNKLGINYYFIEKTNRKDTVGAAIYALYYQDTTSKPFKKIELVEGINEMKIKYTVLENHQLVEYPADQITESSKVRAVSIKLLFSSLNQAHLKKSEYLYVAL